MHYLILMININFYNINQKLKKKILFCFRYYGRIFFARKEIQKDSRLSVICDNRILVKENFASVYYSWEIREYIYSPEKYSLCV